jgi:hypothetical protein
VSLDDILAASNVTFDEAKWAFDALVAGYNEWPKIQSGANVIKLFTEVIYCHSTVICKVK